MENSTKIKIAILFIFSLIIALFAGYFFYDKYQEKQGVEMGELLKKSDIKSCKIILGNTSKKIRSNKYIDYEKFSLVKNLCTSKYDFRELDLNIKNCSKIIKANSAESFEGNYLFLENFIESKNNCNKKFLEANISNTIYFNPENDFKSEITIDLNLDIFTDLNKGDVGEEKFLENRIDAKNRLLKDFEIKPKVEINAENIVLYPKKAIISLDLLSEKDYEIKFLNGKILGEKISRKLTAKEIKEEKELFKNNIKKEYNLDNEKKEVQIYLEKYKFKTPEKKYLGLRIENPVSLYQDKNLAKFSVIDYGTKKENISIKICRVDNETYAKIDILRARKVVDKSLKELFTKGMDSLKSFECKNKNLVLRTEINDKTVYVKKTFDFADVIGNPARSGLYFVTFTNSSDRKYNGNLQKPILFGIVDSHITMKLSKNGEAFFFVNDFDGNPLANQNIRLYINEFKAQKEKYNRDEQKHYMEYYSPFMNNVLSEEIVLGKTGADGVLKVNLNEDVKNYFEKTKEERYNYDYNGVDNSFFITAASDTNLSYLKSTWNSGIAPENFGYRIGSWWDNSNGSDDIVLNMWGEKQSKYFSHIYTDRVLYLPGEQVNIKSVIRNSANLSVPENKNFKIIVKDTNDKEVFSSNLKTNYFGSIFDDFTLEKTAKLGYYTIVLQDENGLQLSNSTFSVEVFKNPKFKTTILLNSEGLESGYAKITEEKIKKHEYYDETIFAGKFNLKASISSKYYNGTTLKNSHLKYKIYKQVYYENAWWDDCFYGCYYTPKKELYTSGEGKLDENGLLSIDLPIDFESSYDDFKYIFEVTVTDAIGDKISSSNSIIVKLDETKKRWNSNFSLKFETDKKFYKSGENIKITGELKGGDWTKYFDNKYIFLVKKKEFTTKYVDDVKGYKRPVTEYSEKIEKAFLINQKNFSLKNGKLELNYKIGNTGEYIFEYGQINNTLKIENLEKILLSFVGKSKLEIDVEEKVYVTNYNIEQLKKVCVGDEKQCSIKNIAKKLGCDDGYKKVDYDDENYCFYKEKNIKFKREVVASDLLESNSKKYFSALIYGNTDAKNPIVDDNKIKVYTEKFSYKLGEKAKILIRLPFSKGKILLTTEKQGVINKEYIDVNSNIFFKEIDINDTFVPNAYIGILAIEVEDKQNIKENFVPQYKVGYTEVVVDKTDKKSFIEIKSNKKTYEPREKVNLSFNVKNKVGKAIKTELSVMVIDDSLISLMGNVDVNLLEKFYKKLPFSVQTSITNLAMLKNYYFARPGIVGGSGFGNFKGGDSAVSSRNIFKNTAYYNPSVVTNEKGEADVSFELPDNLTNFRIIVVGNSRDNLFGTSEEFIEVRKDVLVEPKVPEIIRFGDKLKIGANIFNNTNKEIGFKILLNSKALKIKDKKLDIKLGASSSKIVEFAIENNDSNLKNIDYIISVLGDSVENSDKFEGNIKIKKSPVLIKNIFKSSSIIKESKETINIKIPKNTDFKKSKVIVSISNNKLTGIEKIISSLVKYPYGCVEQTASSTLPNAIVKEFNNYFPSLSEISDKSEDNLESGIKRLKSMQQKSGGFAYWQGDDTVDDYITPYIIRTLIDMKNYGAKVPQDMIDKGISYLNNNYSKYDNNTRAEILWTLAKYGKKIGTGIDAGKLNRHNLIAYTYGLVLSDKVKNKKIIDKNIISIRKTINNNDNYYYYWNNNSDKAIFVSLLMDYNYDFLYIDSLISDLYNKNWEGYYYSTQEKNNAFMAFIKFIKKHSASEKNTFGYSVGKQLNRGRQFSLSGNNNNFYRKEFILSDVAYNGNIDFTVANISGERLYIDINLKHYPKDIEKIESYSNEIKLQRNILEVVDETSMEKCEELKNGYYRNKKEDIEKYCAKAYKKHEGNIFNKSKLYKVELETRFNNNNARRNFTIEDYLPASFRVLNSKFNTNSISTTQNSTKNSRSWSHVELNSDVVFASSNYVYGNKVIFEYFFIPEFAGEFTYPPETAYLMYNPSVRANGVFRKITVK